MPDFVGPTLVCGRGLHSYCGRSGCPCECHGTAPRRRRPETRAFIDAAWAMLAVIVGVSMIVGAIVTAIALVGN